jgi:hypothetical protein
LKNLVLDGGTAPSTEKLIFLGGTAYSKEEYLFFSPQLDLNDMGAEDSVPLTQEDYRQLKFVTFHKRIGQKKNIGFRYGMNLKSITRSLDSGDIATKLIVKSNSNEFADGGSCNIARAKENPSGENFVYDFTHYIRWNLLDQDNLNNDLYYIDNPDNPRAWIGLYARLKPLNQHRDELITQQLALSRQ